jgi:hypothetical protein
MGEWVDSAQHTESINPATGEVIGTYADGGREEAIQATKAAVRTFRELDWKDNRTLRSRVLNQIADDQFYGEHKDWESDFHDGSRDTQAVSDRTWWQDTDDHL